MKRNKKRREGGLKNERKTKIMRMLNRELWIANYCFKSLIMIFILIGALKIIALCQTKLNI